MSHMCSAVQCLVCFWVCMVCLGFEMGFSECVVFLVPEHVLVSLWVSLYFFGGVDHCGRVLVCCMVLRQLFWVHHGWRLWRGVLGVLWAL